MIIIIINGESGVGKDTVVKCFEDMAAKSDYVVKNIDSVAKVKEAATVLGWDGVKTCTSRSFLHTLKLLSDDAFNSSTNYVMGELEKCVGSKTIAFVHVREADSIRKLDERINNEYGIKCIKLRIRGGASVSEMPGDNTINDIYYNFTIDNTSSLEVLKENVASVYNGIALSTYGWGLAYYNTK